MLLEGVHIPLTTPFYPDGPAYLRKLEHNVRRCSLTPVSGLAALTGISEMEMLSDVERRDVLRVVGAEAAKEKVLLAGAGLPGVRESLLLAEAAAQARFDAVLLSAPVEFRHMLWNNLDASPTLLTYFEAIADRTPLPLVLVSDAERAVLPLSLIERLSTHPNVLGLLEQSSHVSRIVQVRELTRNIHRMVTTTITFTAATSRMLHAAEPLQQVGGSFVSAEALSGGAAVATAPPKPALKTRTKEVGFQILWGRAEDSIKALRAGATGLLQPIAASVPQAAFEVWAAWKDGDASLMREKHDRLARAEKGIAPYDIAAIKSGCELAGYFGGRPRLPLLAPTGERQSEIASLLRGMRS